MQLRALSNCCFALAFQNDDETVGWGQTMALLDWGDAARLLGRCDENVDVEWPDLFSFTEAARLQYAEPSDTELSAEAQRLFTRLMRRFRQRMQTHVNRGDLAQMLSSQQMKPSRFVGAWFLNMRPDHPDFGDTDASTRGCLIDFALRTGSLTDYVAAAKRLGAAESCEFQAAPKPRRRGLRQPPARTKSGKTRREAAQDQHTKVRVNVLLIRRKYPALSGKSEISRMLMKEGMNMGYGIESLRKIV